MKKYALLQQKRDVTGGTIRAYLLDSSDKLIADDSSATEWNKKITWNNAVRY